MTKSHHLNRTRATWTDDMIQALRNRYPHERTADIARDIGIPLAKVYAKASWLGLKKTKEFLASPASGRTNGRQGVGSRFQKGHQTWNKGKHYVAGGRSADTRFKKGEMRGAAQHNYVPIGTLRINDDGTLQRKMNDDPNIMPALRWVAVHRQMWIDANGPVPDGHIVAFKPGMRTNKLEEITLDKIECITRSENMRRNTYHNYPKEIAQVIQLRGALTRQINKKEQSHE